MRKKQGNPVPYMFCLEWFDELTGRWFPLVAAGFTEEQAAWVRGYYDSRAKGMQIRVARYIREVV
jgi:hypothetical protein